MGKGTIISGGAGGQYQVSMQYNVQRAQAEKTANMAKIANLETQIAAETDTQKLNTLKLQKLALEKRNEAMDAIPESETISCWCADLTEDLSGDVGLVEIPGESQAFNIQPGYEDNAVYDATRDGQLTPTMAMHPAAAFYNLAMLPGWQKWKPTYRYGTITAITGDLANVTLAATTSTQQSLGVNQASALSDVTIEYMNCNGSAFEVGDEVLLAFTGQDWASPKIIGFNEDPRICSCAYILLKHDSQEEGASDRYWYVVWDVLNNAFADITWEHEGAEYHFNSWPINDQIIEIWWSEEKIKFSYFQITSWNYDLYDNISTSSEYYIINWVDGDGAFVGDDILKVDRYDSNISDLPDTGEWRVREGTWTYSIRSGYMLGHKHYDGRHHHRLFHCIDGSSNRCSIYEVTWTPYHTLCAYLTCVNPRAELRKTSTPHLVSYVLFAKTENVDHCSLGQNEYLNNDWNIQVHVSPLHSYNLIPTTIPGDVPENTQLSELFAARATAKGADDNSINKFYNYSTSDITGEFSIDAISYMGDEP